MLDLYKGKSQMNFTWNVHILYDFYTLSLRWLVFFHMRFFRVSFGVTFWHMIHFISHVSFTQDSSIMWFFFFFWYMNSFSWFVYFHVIFTHDSFLFTRYMIHLFHVNFDAHFISRDFYTQLFYLHMIHLFSREFWHMNHLISRDFYTQIFSFHMIHDSFIFT